MEINSQNNINFPNILENNQQNNNIQTPKKVNNLLFNLFHLTQIK